MRPDRSSSVSGVGRRVRRWWRAAIASAAILSPQAVAAQPVHDVQIVAARFAFEPATIEVRAGERVRLVIRSTDVVHGFSIPGQMKADVVQRQSISLKGSTEPISRR